MNIGHKLFLVSKILFAKNKIIDQILVAAQNGHAINMDYVSKTSKEFKNYVVIPIEMKERKLTDGISMVLYAEDVNDENRTKTFVISNIKRINEINKKYKSINPIKIKGV